MNEQDALSRFITDNFTALTVPDLDLKGLKSLERAYYQDKIREKLARPTNKQIIIALVNLMRKRGLAAERIQEYISDLPIFGFAGETLRDQVFDDVQETNIEGAIEQSDIETIRTVGAYEAIRDKVGRQVEQERLRAGAELDEEIARKRSEYESMPSILDVEEPDEPDYDPTIDHVRAWWERFYLRGDPFPRKDGLSNIDKSLYDDIIVMTPPFARVLSSLNTDPSCLFNTAFLLVGDYGYGKTTFIDYLSNYLINVDVLPIRITPPRPCSDSRSYADQFYLKLGGLLRAEAVNLGLHVPPSLSDLEIDDVSIELATLVTQKRWRGIVVFMDDYHKHTSQLPHIYEFLGFLQILKDTLTRREIQVGFIVSGTPEWEVELSTNGQMAGFLDNTPIEMPAITPELVCKVFNQRIRAYCYDKSPRSLRLDFVEMMFGEVEGKQGYRAYLNRIISELSSNNLAIIDAPIDIPNERLAFVKEELERDGALKSSLNRLVFESKFKRYTHEQVLRCLELLIHTSLQNTVTEDDRLFMENKFHFMRLRDVSLIQKARSSKSHGTAWTTHSRLRGAAQSIKDRYNLGLGDYLLKVYGGRSYSKAAPDFDDLLPAAFGLSRAYLSSNQYKATRAARNSIELAIQTFDATVLAERNGRCDIETVRRGEASLEYISRALFEIDQSHTNFRQLKIEDLETRWQMHWAYDECLAEVFKRLDACRTDASKTKIDLALKQIRDAFPVIADRLSVAIRSANGIVPTKLLHRSNRHSVEELRLFEQVCEMYDSPIGGTHFDYVKMITEYLERRMRAFLFVSSVLTFGDPAYVSEMPDAVRKYAYKNIQGGTYSAVSNAYDGFTRPQFRSTFTSGSKLKTAVVEPIPLTWPTKDWEQFFDLFVEENIKTSHQKLASYDASDRDRYFNYSCLAEEFTARLNELVCDMPWRAYVLVGDLVSPEGEPGVKYLMRKPKPDEDTASQHNVLGEIPAFLAKANLAAHSLPTNVVQKICRQITDSIASSPSKCLIEDLLDIEYIATHYGAPYQDFLTSAIIGWRLNRDFAISKWFGSSIMFRLVLDT